MSIEIGDRQPNIPPEIQKVIENQRGRLQQASTLLTCLWIAHLYQEWHDVEIDAADVARVVRAMIDEVVDTLDIVVLNRAVEGPAGDKPDDEDPDDEDLDDLDNHDPDNDDTDSDDLDSDDPDADDGDGDGDDPDEPSSSSDE